MTTTSNAKVLTSKLDASRNFVLAHGSGLIESRYVRRSPDYFIVYISSQTGCAEGCRFCHLTQTNQTSAEDLTPAAIFAQADEVLKFYSTLGDPAREVHFNFMARGEPFGNRYVLTCGDELVSGLQERARALCLVPSIKFSTIIPASIFGRGNAGTGKISRFVDIFMCSGPDLYYSLYSMNDRFRRRWLPRAADPEFGLELLADWQATTRKIPVLHWAFIGGENDSAEDIAAIGQAVRAVGLRCDVNIVRYNPYSERQGVEPGDEVLLARASQLHDELMGARIKIISRVGVDVGASCGMFVGGRRPVIPFSLEP